MTEQTPDAPGGERAQEEPIQKPHLHNFNQRRDIVVEGVAIGATVLCACGLGLNAFLDQEAPRPAEPEPPKAEQEPRVGTLKCDQCEDDPWVIAFAWGRVWQAGDTCPRHYEDDDSCDGELVPVVSQPKADTGTLDDALELLACRAKRDVETRNKGEQGFIDGVYLAHLKLRDALTELRQLRWQRDSEQAKLSATLTELVKARAASPDLRGLVEKWRQAARREASPSPHDYGFNKGRLLCADELEATLTGTGEPTNGDV